MDSASTLVSARKAVAGMKVVVHFDQLFAAGHQRFFLNFLSVVTHPSLYQRNCCNPRFFLLLNSDLFIRKFPLPKLSSWF